MCDWLKLLESPTEQLHHRIREGETVVGLSGLRPDDGNTRVGNKPTPNQARCHFYQQE